MFCKNEIEEYLQKDTNRKPVIMTSIDEVTFVIKPTEDTVGDYPDNWHQIASTLSEIIANKLSLPILFGNYIPLKTPPAGYTDGFTFQDLPYYFAIAWHQTNFTMGIILKFSASALSQYKSSYQDLNGKSIDVHNMAQLLDEDYYELRLSRIDFAVDYFNYKLTVNDLYQGLKTKQYIITNNKGRKNISKISAQEVNGYAQTVYIGSKKKNINALLRIYNKYQEQLDNQGRYMHLTKFCDSWIRMEASYKGTYSNQILALLLTLESSEDLSKLIVNKILDKYCFYKSTNGEALDVTSDLMKSMGDFPALESLSSRNNDLMATILYLMKGSGFYPLLWKIETIWGTEARNYFIIRLVQEYDANYVPNPDVGIWLSKFGDKLSNLNFKDLLEDAFQIFYQKNNINPKNSAKNNKNDVAD
ncbi:replication initiation protein [Streptococcus suis]|uniref:Replication initiation factor domain-containing protein n=1 Tax=Streptococcus suis TaxID=1307 RepID=A0A345S4R0_STRSU|nr:replication initiation factor domain-containing protein [Streptococcus suis]AXI68552.1 replication initiation protein [Streptococcus suis]MBY4634774.1 replication initiation factor domain-containing protein [Streptococcus suis]TII04523.1 replication initiation factor domain-containing protein [Streptococcus suis]